MQTEVEPDVEPAAETEAELEASNASAMETGSAVSRNVDPCKAPSMWVRLKFNPTSLKVDILPKDNDVDNNVSPERPAKRKKSLNSGLRFPGDQQLNPLPSKDLIWDNLSSSVRNLNKQVCQETDALIDSYLCKLESDREKLENERDDRQKTQTRLSESERKIQELDQQLQAARHELNLIMNDLDSARASENLLREEKEKLVQNAKSDVSTLKAGIQDKDLRIQNLEANLSNMQGLVDFRDGQIQQIARQVQEKESNLKVNLLAANVASAKMRKEHEEQVNELKACIEANQDQLNELRSKMKEDEDDKTSENKKLWWLFSRVSQDLGRTAHGLDVTLKAHGEAETCQIKLKSELEEAFSKVDRRAQILDDILRDQKESVSLHS